MKDQTLEQAWNTLIKQEGYSVNDKVCIRKAAAMRMLAGLAEYGYKYSKNEQSRCPNDVTEEDFYKLYEQKQQLQVNKLLENEVSFEISRVQITHAIGSSGFIPKDERYNENWLEFWEANVLTNVKKKYKYGIKDPVGAHVVDKDCNVYIMPCENDENFEEGEKGSQMSEKIFLSVPKEALVKVKKADSQRKDNNSITWEEFIKRNKEICEKMKKMANSQFKVRWAL